MRLGVKKKKRRCHVLASLGFCSECMAQTQFTYSRTHSLTRSLTRSLTLEGIQCGDGPEKVNVYRFEQCVCVCVCDHHPNVHSCVSGHLAKGVECFFFFCFKLERVVGPSVHLQVEFRA